MNVSSGLGYGCPLLEEPRALNYVLIMAFVVASVFDRSGVVLYHLRD